MFAKNHLRLTIYVLLVLIISVSSVSAQFSNGLKRKIALYQNPVFDFDFPDPTVIRAADGYFYAYATQSVVNNIQQNIQTARSLDLVHWERLADALPVKPSWANQTQNFWAPHVVFADNKYFMYYSADPNTRTGLCLAVATATSPAGPFTDKGTPLKCGSGFINIDPMAFDDPATGKHLLYWGSGFDPIAVQELAADRLNFAAGSLLSYQIYPVSNSNPSNYRNLVEGAWMTFRGGYYYLFFFRRRLLHERTLRDYGSAFDFGDRTV